MASTNSGNTLPSGLAIFTSIPDLLFIPEFVLGGVVWTLVASTHVIPSNPLGYVMFVSIGCFIFTAFWFFIFVSGNNKSSICVTLDVAGHALAAFFYLSSSVMLAYITFLMSGSYFISFYHRDIAAVVMSFLATLLYAVHTVFSAIRWRSLIR